MRIQTSCAVAACLLAQVAAQDQAETCYGAGSVVGAVVGTLIVTLGLMSVCLFLYKTYWKNRKGKHLVLMTDTENPHDQYAFDNPCFREATPIKHNIQEEKPSSKLEKNKWLGWTSLHSFGKEQKGEKITSMDDSHVNDSRLKVVTLKSHDFTGLGFNICGNMRDGIFVKDVLHRGPAFESGCINSGDRIDSICISFRNMVYEDALTILSYASPYDVQVQVENDSYSRPSTLIRSKRESNAVSSVERILHPIFNRSQSVSNLNEIGKNNKKTGHQIGFMQEKNRINQNLHKSQEFTGSPNDYPTIKVSAASNHPKKENQKLEKSAAPRPSPSPNNKKQHFDSKEKEISPQKSDSPDGRSEPQNKLQKFGIKVLPINNNPKMGVQSVTAAKKTAKSPTTVENEINSTKEKPEKPVKPSNLSPRSSPEVAEATDDLDGSQENMKGILAKGLQNLKEKINQNTLGKKKNKENEEAKGKETGNVVVNGGQTLDTSEMDCPVPKLRSTVACGVKAYEKSQQNHLQNSVPEEVSRAGDVARNNRRSITDPSTGSRKSTVSLSPEPEDDNVSVKNKKVENGSDTDSFSDKDSSEAKKPKKSKGKAPAPPGSDLKSSASSRHSVFNSNEIDEIKRESDLPKNENMSIFEPTQNSGIVTLKEENEMRRNHLPSYDSDSDSEPITANSGDSLNSTKIELNATQVTIHQNPAGDGNDDDIEPNRKAASLGDLSKLDSEQPLSIVLERAVSLDLTEGTTQSGKKRKAPLPPSEEFPTVFDDLNYRKEPRLENPLGLNTFQRRLKKSSDFGTLEDALCDGPKSLEIEINKLGPSVDLTETHNNNIQEFSSWLAECRKPKLNNKDSENRKTTMNSTSLVNIGSSENERENEDKPSYEYQGGNVSFSVNGQNFPDLEMNEKASGEPQSFAEVNSRTVVVISQPNSLEPTIVETAPISYKKDDETHAKESEERPAEPEITTGDSHDSFVADEETTPPKLPTTPMPVATTPGTVSSPLSSSLTYITEIKVSTLDRNENSRTPTQSNSSSLSGDSIVGLEPNDAMSISAHRTESVRDKIEKFDKNSFAAKGFISPNTKTNDVNDEYLRKENHTVYESSKIPIRTMKSETGQKVLATIHSLAANDSSPTKTPEIEYAKRVASLFSGSNQTNNRNKNEASENEINRPNISGLYFKSSPPKPSTDYFPTRKVPPVVPPRKTETSLSGKSTVTVELPGKNGSHLQERNLVTFSSFIPSSQKEEPGSPSKLSFTFKDEVNGKNSVVPVKTSATKIIFESAEHKDDF